MMQIISILMENKPGALMRVTGLFAQRNYNIESLTVARTFDPLLSRMTIVADVDPKIRPQVIKQITKLVNVLQATDLTDAPSVARELVLLRIRATMENRTAILKEAEIFHARVVDSSVDGFALEATGEPEKLDEFINVMATYGDVQVTRFGEFGLGRVGGRADGGVDLVRPGGADALDRSQIGDAGGAGVFGGAEGLDELSDRDRPDAVGEGELEVVGERHPVWAVA